MKYVLIRLLLNDKEVEKFALDKLAKKMKEDKEFEVLVSKIMKHVRE